MGAPEPWLLLGLLKPQLLIGMLVALLPRRYWSALLVFGVGSGSILLVSFVILGNWVPSYAAMLRYIQDPRVDIGEAPVAMQNWRALVYHLLGTDTAPLALGLWGALTVLTVGLMLALSWPHRLFRAVAWEVRFAVILLLGLLVQPHLYLHDMVVALLPGFLLWQASGAALARYAALPAARRLHALRWTLGVGPFIFFVAQFWTPPYVALVPWYILVLVGIVLWAWNALDGEPAPGLPTTA